MGLQLMCVLYCLLVLWLRQRASFIVVNGGKPRGKATPLQFRVCGNGYKSIALEVTRLKKKTKHVVKKCRLL